MAPAASRAVTAANFFGKPSRSTCIFATQPPADPYLCSARRGCDAVPVCLAFVVVALAMFSLILVIIGVIRRIEIYGIQQDARDRRVHLRRDVARSPQRRLRGLQGAYRQQHGL